MRCGPDMQGSVAAHAIGAHCDCALGSDFAQAVAQEIVPTVGFNVETVTYKNVKFNVWVCCVVSLGDLLEGCMYSEALIPLLRCMCEGI